MIDSQSQIIERLRDFNCDDITKRFIIQIMEFYKGHMSKLQGIIIQKQAQIDEFFELKQRYETHFEELTIELEDVKNRINDDSSCVWQQSSQISEMTSLVSSLKADLQNVEFDRQVLKDDTRNLQNKVEILESQLKMTMNQNVELRSELMNLKQTKTLQKPDFQTTHLLEEIKDIKLHLNNSTKSYIDPMMKSSQVSIGRRGQSDIDTSFERPPTSRKNESLSKVTSEHIPEKEIKTETKNVDIDELQHYLSFLQEKEKSLQDRLWKMPQRDRSVNEKKERLGMESQLEEVFNEIHSIKQLLKQSK